MEALFTSTAVVALAEIGDKTQLQFHVAEGITQPLASVAACNDAENIVIFDSSGDFHGSKIVKANRGREVDPRAIRELVKKVRGIELRRVNKKNMNQILS